MSWIIWNLVVHVNIVLIVLTFTRYDAWEELDAVSEIFPKKIVESLGRYWDLYVSFYVQVFSHLSIVSLQIDSANIIE